jgi:exodeoxyribonuclease V gamma subunit
MLHVHRSERADHLVDILAGVIGEPLPDPMAAEVVAVPTRGVERWLTQRLSHRLGCSRERRDGVAANIDFPFPGVLVGDAITRATGGEPGEDPWAPERAVWPLLAVIDANLSDPRLSPLAKHLAAASPRRDDGALARFAAARHLADLYDRYGVHRPDLVRGWATTATVDRVSSGPLGRHAWQAVLWQLLRDRIGVPSPAERLLAAVERLTGAPGLLDLPDRVSLFGLTRLPASYLAVLQALAASRDVHLFLLHPSGALWDAVAAGCGQVPVDLTRHDDGTTTLALNGLLRSWGRDAREMQLVLSAYGAVEGEYRPVDVVAGSRAEPATLLQRIQRDVRRNIAIPPLGGAGEDRPVLDPSDTSLSVHSCHGRYRQVEVMREAILHLLAQDPSLEPRDVIVMCPDVETFAPLIEAVFGFSDPDGAPEEDPGRQLRVRLADRSLRQTNPLLAVAAALLELADGRMAASEVVDLAGRDPVRRRFGFDDDELAQIERWVSDVGIRWGLDAAHRHVWKLGELRENTWDFGLDRLLLGVAMAEDGNRLFGGVLPLDDVPSGSVDLAGRFTEFVNRLGSAMRELRGRKPLREWCLGLARATESLSSAGAGESWQLTQMRRLLDEPVLEASGRSASQAEATQAPLTPPEVRSLLAHRLRGQPTRANFRTGDMTVCTLVPMRSVPHRVVCLLGMDDGVFPRHPERDGDDLIAADPRVGDRDARSEDRQLLLDALLAATDHLVVTYGGRDERTNHPRPPAVPIAELLDAVDRTVRAPDGMARAREAIMVEHPLQSFDPRNFTAGTLLGQAPWGFGRLELAGARSLAGGARPKARFLPEPLPQRSSDVVNLDSLVRFFRHPVQAFLRERLGVFVAADITGSDETVDSMPIDLDALEKWSVGDRVLRARVRGTPLDAVTRAERARGILPPGHLADEVLAEITASVERLVGWLEAVVAGVTDGSHVPRTAEINLELPDGRLLLGTVPGVTGTTVVNAVYSRLAPKHRVEAWIRFLALSACRPGDSCAAVTVARSPRQSDQGPAASVIVWEKGAEPCVSRTAVEHLVRLIDLYERGMVEPLPLYCGTSLAWAQARRAGEDAVAVASATWDNGYLRKGEGADDCHRLVLGGTRPFNSLLEESPLPDEHGEGWDGVETSRFGRLARRLWDPLLEREAIKFP